MGSRNDVLDMLRFVEESGLKPIVDTVYPLEEALDAHKKLVSGEQFGKLVLEIND